MTALVCVGMLGGVAAPAYAADDASDALAVIGSVAPDVLDGVAAPSDLDVAHGDDALVVDSGEVVTSLPVDAADGIEIDGGGEQVVTIGLPNADTAAPAEDEATGIVSYDNGDGSTTVPIAKSDGSVQITTVIEGSEAPQVYEYELELPAGATLQQDQEGFVSIVSADGEFLGGVAAAWATDATGADVATHYEIADGTLTQVVEHGPAAEYPVVADPWVGVDLIRRTVWTSSMQTLQVYPTDWGRNAPIAARWAAWAEVQTKTPGTRENTSAMTDQLLCHFDGRIFDMGKTSWNIDIWRPYVLYTTLLRAKCNNS